MSCTTILVGKNASYDGSTIIARDDDSGSGRYDPKRFVAVAPDDQPRHYRSVLSHVEIELPDNPCRYTIAPNVLNNRGILAEAGANEHNVAMSATETIAVNERVLGADPMVELRPAVGEPDSTDYQAEQPGGIGEEDIIARRVPDDCYATIPNQLGIDDFDLADAFGEQREYLCSADLREFMATHHLDRTMGTPVSSNGRHAHSAGFGTTVALPTRFNPRKAFGTATPKDHIYNTPRAWYMQRRLNPSEDWDSPAARYTPESDDIPWCRVPEDKVSLEDVDFLLSSHFEGTPYDPYGTTGTAESRHRYRPIGVNRTGHMVAIQVRPYVPAANRTVMWVSFGSGPFTAAAPFYANVNDTPAYLRDTTPEVSTGNRYWTNRLIAVVADAHWYETNRFIEGYAEGVRAFGHRLIERTDEQLLARSDAESTDTNAWPLDGGHGDEKDVQGVADALEAANDEMADYLREHTTKLLNDVLYTSSNLMHNSFAMSDRWAE